MASTADGHTDLPTKPVCSYVDSARNREGLTRLGRGSSLWAPF